MLLGVIADDFTGASDIANTIAKGHGQEGGLRTVIEAPAAALSAASFRLAMKVRSAAAKPSGGTTPAMQ